MWPRSARSNPDNGFPEWYRDENGVTIQACLDPKRRRLHLWRRTSSSTRRSRRSSRRNFPSEFFYQLATSDNVTTPGCNGSAHGRALLRTGVEGAFVNAGPVPGEQMTFGRIRMTVTGGLCPGQHVQTSSPRTARPTWSPTRTAAIARNAGTEDVGCVPVAPDTCDFTVALSSRVLASFLRWDPAVAPPAPAGYIGDGVTLHKVIGAPYSPDGITPANYFQIKDATGPSGR